jgi:hypothetical protein
VPLGKVAKARTRWLTNVVAYSLAGVASSTLVGLTLGGAGQLLVPSSVAAAGPVAVLAVAGAAAARELGWLRVPLLQPRRQTRDRWSMRFPQQLTAALWGFDIGLTITTRFTFAGTWVLLTAAVTLRDPTLGAIALASFWLGRSLPAWLGLLLFEGPNSTRQVFDLLLGQRRRYQLVHVVAIGLLTTYLISALTSM